MCKLANCFAWDYPKDHPTSRAACLSISRPCITAESTLPRLHPAAGCPDGARNHGDYPVIGLPGIYGSPALRSQLRRASLQTTVGKPAQGQRCFSCSVHLKLRGKGGRKHFFHFLLPGPRQPLFILPQLIPLLCSWDSHQAVLLTQYFPHFKHGTSPDLQILLLTKARCVTQSHSIWGSPSVKDVVSLTPEV